MMTEQQKRFCDEYITSCNATSAYKKAYPKVKNDSVAAANSSRLLKKPEIKAYIDERLEQLASKRIANAQEVLEYLTSVMRGESESEVVVIERDEEGQSRARVVKKGPDEKEKLKAAELVGKRHQLFTEKHEVSSTQAVVIVDDIDD